ncbi:Adenylate and Guanylate cyclase catalytic domain containing protein [Trichomonas vaginalis G3]|uniref:Adenylate and Guanylate cyclase catalytic domain containing protein n=1 Tax=Trichomonas vaginalis (strain ATCC PRA-98 / G3) TaxID=412133 RepID=A2FWD6_TRIV3|nr:guanylate cyclase protein [Trichomonas vaginalis G3]EAX90800.1 Adenylate and Guanylate cyclase catalytic domain containing protein [Trichomonas vaginalis G3]KAI5507045.1 guanylate cyclase protein [Trichomonas vaginalis G3]|eukprot:XP_001303730.1 Adenylate and Guanylate cyclase catalytic domain containing protein [Trichomonas vaginalis G3]
MNGNQATNSVGSASTEANSQLLGTIRTDGLIDMNFPLIMNVFQTHISILIGYPFLFAYFLQVLFMSIWPWNKYMEGFENYPVLKWIYQILYMRRFPSTENDYFIQAIIIFVPNIIILFINFYQLSYYKLNRKFISAMNYPLRLYFESLMIATNMPAMVGALETLFKIFHGNFSYKIIISCILFLFTYIYEYFGFIMIQSLASRTAFLTKGPLTNFDPAIMIYVIVTNIIVMNLYFLLRLFESWAQLLAILLHMGVYAYLSYYMSYYQPFIDVLFQALGDGWFFGVTVGDLLSFICYFIKKDMHYYPLVGALIVFGLATGCALIYSIIKRKKIIKQLDKSFSSKDDATDYFDELGLADNELTALLYLRIAFISYSPCFYEWTLVNYLIDTYNEELTLSTCLQMVHFFPKETRLLNKISKLLLKRRSLAFLDRFLIFQIDAVKTLRNFTVSNASKLKLVELRTMSRQCEMLARGAVDSPKLGTEYFESLAEKTQSANAIWRESILSSPNNPKFCEEFAKYLINAECDFPGGLKMKHRQNIIEFGTSFSVDNSFRMMIAAFPKYLTEKIVDFQGKIIKNNGVNRKAMSNMLNGTNGSNGSNNSNSSSSLETDISDFDNQDLGSEVEEHLGKLVLTLPRERLALHRCLMNKIPLEIKYATTTMIWNVLLCCALFIFGWQYSSFALKKQVEGMDQIESFAFARFYSSVSNTVLEIADYMSKEANAQKLEAIKDLFHSDDDPIFKLFNESLLLQMLSFSTNSSSEFTEVFDHIANEALNGDNVEKYIAPIIDTKWEFHVCHGTQPLPTADKMSFSSMLSLLIVYSRILSGAAEPPHLNNSPEICMTVLNYMSIYNGSLQVFESITNNQQDIGSKWKKRFNVLQIALPIVIFFLVLAPLLTIHVMSSKSLHLIIDMIKSFDIKAKSQAKEPIMLNSYSDDIKVADYHSTTKRSAVLLFILFVISACIFICAFFGFRLVVNSNSSINKITNWNYLAAIRLALSSESAGLTVMVASLMNYVGQFNYLDPTLTVRLSYFVLSKLVQVDKALVDGTSTIPACSGFDQSLDELNLIDSEISSDVDDPTRTYVNASIHKMIDVYYSFAYSIIQSMSKSPPSYNINDLVNAIYLTNYRLFSKELKFSSRLIELAEKETTNFTITISIIFAAYFVLLLILILFSYVYELYRKYSYQAALMVLKRFSPYELLNNKLFNQVFLKGKSDNKNEKLSVEGNIIKNSNSPIFCTSLAGMIEIVNNGTTELLRYTPEQMLGQSISVFFKEREVMVQKLEIMKNGQSSNYVEEDLTTFTDSGNEKPVHVTIIGMKKDNDNDINSFVITMRDQTELISQKKQAEEAKAKSEKLLYQILPRDVVVQLNKGEKDISFVVPSATIIFIDINKFSEYSANLTPQDIMANLNHYFACIDKIAAKYNMLQKIKLIGDIYMAAAGLFNTDSPAEQHAEQTILFGLDVVATMDEINLKLDANLQIRVGINSGGPVIAGVLGTDKPVFDIIGDPINVAARLQSTCEVNRVHISQATFDLVKGSNFDVVQRGETFLKGKGKQITYYINSPSRAFNTLGSQQFIINQPQNNNPAPSSNLVPKDSK